MSLSIDLNCLSGDAWTINNETDTQHISKRLVINYEPLLTTILRLEAATLQNSERLDAISAALVKAESKFDNINDHMQQVFNNAEAESKKNIDRAKDDMDKWEQNFRDLFGEITLALQDLRVGTNVSTFFETLDDGDDS